MEISDTIILHSVICHKIIIRDFLFLAHSQRSLWKPAFLWQERQTSDVSKETYIQL